MCYLLPLLITLFSSLLLNRLHKKAYQKSIDDKTYNEIIDLYPNGADIFYKVCFFLAFIPVINWITTVVAIVIYFGILCYFIYNKFLNRIF